MALSNETILTVIDTLESARENVADLLSFAAYDGRQEDAAILRESMDEYDKAIAEFTSVYSSTPVEVED